MGLEAGLARQHHLRQIEKYFNIKREAKIHFQLSLNAFFFFATAKVGVDVWSYKAPDPFPVAHEGDHSPT